MHTLVPNVSSDFVLVVAGVAVASDFCLGLVFYKEPKTTAPLNIRNNLRKKISSKTGDRNALNVCFAILFCGGFNVMTLLLEKIDTEYGKIKNWTSVPLTFMCITLVMFTKTKTYILLLTGQCVDRYRYCKMITGMGFCKVQTYKTFCCKSCVRDKGAWGNSYKTQ